MTEMRDSYRDATYTSLRGRSVTHSKMTCVSEQVPANKYTYSNLNNEGDIFIHRSALTEDCKNVKQGSQGGLSQKLHFI